MYERISIRKNVKFTSASAWAKNIFKMSYQDISFMSIENVFEYMLSAR